MKIPQFDNLPDVAQLWIYGFDGNISPEVKAQFASDLDCFVDSWTSHSEPVIGASAIVEDRFVLLAGHCDAGIGGCSIDGSVAVIRSFAIKYGLDGFNRDLVFYRGGDGAVEAVSRAEFQSGVEAGTVGASTVVFDLTLTSLRTLREGRFETTFDNSWHVKAFQT